MSFYLLIILFVILAVDFLVAFCSNGPVRTEGKEKTVRMLQRYGVIFGGYAAVALIAYLCGKAYPNMEYISGLLLDPIFRYSVSLLDRLKVLMTKPKREEKPEKPETPENPKTPSTPSTPGKPVPQTGDDPFIFLYGGLLALAVMGGGMFAVLYFKKGKYSRQTPRTKAAGIAVLSLCAALAVGSGFLMVRDLGQYSESAGAYDDLAELALPSEPTDAPEDAAAGEEPDGDSPAVNLPSVDFETLRASGPDIIGWLTLPDTAINYPVTQTDNNEYYLKHLYDGTYNKAGCLFADYENKADFSDRNTIIYGHNMRDGSMLAVLNEYDEQRYFDEHPQMYLVTPEGGYLCEIFAAFTAKPSESGSETSPWRLSWKDDGAYTTWLTAMAERSVVETDVTVTSSDKVLTLSTCTPGGASRFIVMAKLVEVNNENQLDNGAGA